MSDKPLTFEEALSRLESIAQQIERGQIGLEQSIARYEEGMSLVRQCREMLARAEHRIQQIHQHADGTIELGDFNVPADKENAEKQT